jgi:hypothetical protein
MQRTTAAGAVVLILFLLGGSGAPAGPAQGSSPRLDAASARVLGYLPADFPIYKPSRVHGAGPLPLGRGYAVEFSTPDPGHAVLAFYNRSLPARGWRITEQRSILLTAAKGSHRVAVSVSQGTSGRRFVVSVLRGRQ